MFSRPPVACFTLLRMQRGRLFSSAVVLNFCYAYRRSSPNRGSIHSSLPASHLQTFFNKKSRLFLLDRLCGATRKKASWNVLCRMQQLVNLSIFLNYLGFFYVMYCFFVRGLFFCFLLFEVDVHLIKCQINCTIKDSHVCVPFVSDHCGWDLITCVIWFFWAWWLESRMTPLNVLMSSQRFPCPSWKSVALKCHVS